MFNDDMGLEFLKQVVGALGRLLGDKCEVVLHDLRSPESSVIAIAHGEITGRKVGDSSTNLALPVLKDPFGEHDKFNYRSVTRSGRTLKSSSVYFKDPEGRVFAALCVNYDISEMQMVANVLQEFTQTEYQENEHFANDINEVINRILEETFEANRTALLLNDKDERLNLIADLNDKGVFSVKGAVDRVAAMLGVSRVTVYGYLNEVQARKDSAG